MTANELQSLARILSNQTWCRHWLNLHNSKTPVTMAIQCRDCTGQPETVMDLENRGFKMEAGYMYTIKRTNEDGTDFVSELF